MNVLIVEDDAAKRVQIVQWLNTQFETANVTHAGSVNEALRVLKAHSFDLILLDISLPTFTPGVSESGGRSQGFGGREVLQYLERRGAQPIVVVVTQFQSFGHGDKLIDLPTFADQLHQAHPNLFFGYVYYERSGVWRDELSALIHNAFESQQERNAN
jgi:CheY-like chemotaxis protein